MMINDFMGQHTVATCGNCFAFSSDIFDWEAFIQLCTFLEVLILKLLPFTDLISLQMGGCLGAKTYLWIEGALEFSRKRRKLWSVVKASCCRDTFTEILVELIDRQLYQEGELKYDIHRLGMMKMAAECLLKNNATGIIQDIQKGARTIGKFGNGSYWWKDYKEGQTALSDALSCLIRHISTLKGGTVSHSEYHSNTMTNMNKRCENGITWTKESDKRRNDLPKERNFPMPYTRDWFPRTQLEVKILLFT